MTTSVVLCIDGSSQAFYAFNFYLDFLHKPTNKVVVIHCVEMPTVKKSHKEKLGDTHVSLGTLSEMMSEEKHKATKLEQKYLDNLHERKITGVKFWVGGGAKPGVTIVEKAEEEGADIVIMGTRGLGTVKRTIMGSVSDYVVHHAHCPVFIARK